MRRLAIVSGVLLVAVTHVWAPAPVAAQSTGGLAGTVVAAGTGAPVAGVVVQTYRSDGYSTYRSATTDASGHYVVTGLSAGTYYARADVVPGAYLRQHYLGLDCTLTCPAVLSGAPVVVTPDSVTLGIDFALHAAAQISGTVVAARTLAPIAGVTIQAYDAGGYSIGVAGTTDGSGRYTVGGLASGSFYLKTTTVPTGWFGQVYDRLDYFRGYQSVTAGTTVSTTQGATTAGIDFVLEAGGTIRGTVRDVSGATRIAGVQITAYDAAGQSVTTAASTNESGEYVIAGLVGGTYYLMTSSVPSGWLRHVYSGVDCGQSCPAATRGTPVQVAFGGSTNGIDFALAPGGTVTGRVTAAGTGNPVPGVLVRATDANGSSVGTETASDGDGVYLIRGLPTGTYYLRTESVPDGYLRQVYSGLHCGPSCPSIATGTGVAVTQGAVTGSADFVLRPAGSISGTVTAADTGQPVLWAYLSLFSSEGVELASYVRTDNQGRYSIGSLTAGSYFVAVTSAPTGYVGQIFSGVDCVSSCRTPVGGTAVSAIEGTPTTGIDFALRRGGTITGTVTAVETGVPIEGVRVQAYGSDGYSVGSSATTDSFGRYTLGGLEAGTYYVKTSSVPAGYLQQVYRGVDCGLSCPSVVNGTAVVVTFAAATSGIDFALRAGGAITGTVTAAGSAVPLAQVSVRAYDAAGSTVGTAATSDAAGRYAITGLPTGTYYVKTASVPAQYLPQIYAGIDCGISCPAVATGSAVAVTQGTTTAGVDFVLATGGTIAGRVTAAAGGTPLSGVSLRAYASESSQVGSTATTDADGWYRITGVPSGTFYVKTTSVPQGYLREIHGGVTCGPSCPSVTTGAPVVVAAGVETSGIDLALAAPASISGTVRSKASGAPVSWANIAAYDQTGQRVASGSFDSSSSRYSVGSLRAGTYYLVASSVPSGYVKQIYQGIDCVGSCSAATTGTPVVVGVGAAVSGIDFALQSLGSITGTVRSAATGVPLVNARLQAYDSTGRSVGSSASSNNAGEYTIANLQPGTYFVATSTPPSGYFGQVYSGVECGSSCSSVTGGTPVAVSLGAATTGVDFALQAAAAVTGRVSAAATGLLLSDVTVGIYSSTGSQIQTARTNSSGQYVIRGLEAGTYFVATSGSPTGYLNQVYAGLDCDYWGCPPATQGTPVSVLQGATTRGIDLALAVSGSIAGTVRAASTGLPLSGAQIEAYNAGGAQIYRSATAGSDGFYTLRDLPAGTYYLMVTSAPSGYLQQIYRGVDCGTTCPTVTLGTPVVVALGGTTEGVDFALRARGGSIAGAVRDASTGFVVSAARIQVYDRAGRTAGSDVYVGSNGRYHIGSLPAGTYFLRTSSVPAGYLHQLYDNLTCGVSCPAVTSGSGVVVTEGGATSGIDFALQKGGTISGRVRSAATGEPLSSATVYAYDATGREAGYAYASSAGQYALTGLPAGTYFLRAKASSGFEEQVFSGIPCGRACPAVTSGTPVSVTLGAATTGIDFALRPYGRITGTVRSAATGTPLSSVQLLAFDANGRRVDSSVYYPTTGQYEISNLPAGAYYVRTDSVPSGYLHQVHSNVTCGSTCPAVTAGTVVHVAPGVATSGVDFALQMGGMVTGTVTAAATGSPLSGVEVRVFDPSGREVRWAQTSSTGNYLVMGLPAGSYFLQATGGPVDYVGQVYGGLDCSFGCPPATTGTAVAVTLGATTSGIDFALGGGESISGRVTARESGAPVVGASIGLADAMGKALGRYVTTDAEGRYRFGGLRPGRYFAWTANATTAYRLQIYRGLDCDAACPALTDGTLIAVGLGAPATGVDFALAPGSPTATGKIAGTVIAADTRTPVSSAKVVAVTAAGTAAGSGYTDSQGRYEITGLPTAVYYLYTESVPTAYVKQVYQGVDCGVACPAPTSGTGVQVTAGGTLAGIGFELRRTGQISGLVSAADGGWRVSSIRIAVYDASGKPTGRSGDSNSSGRYEVTGLPPGRYFLAAEPGTSGYLAQVYRNVPCGIDCPAVTGGTAVDVGAGATTTDIDFRLETSGRLAGTITDAATGAPLSGIAVQVFDSLGRLRPWSATTNAGGHYVVGGLPAGTFFAVAGTAGSAYLRQVYRGQTCEGACPDPTTGTGIAVTTGSTTPGVDFALQAAGRITGTVLARGTGRPLASATVQAFDGTGRSVASATSDSSGRYEIAGLQNGTYYLSVSTAPSGYVRQIYDDVDCGPTCPLVTTGAPVPATVGTTTAGVDFNLTRAGGITGLVTAADTGFLIASATVRAYAPSGQAVVGIASTDSQGRYELLNLPPGAYFVKASSSSGHVDQVHAALSCPGQACAVTAGTPVAVTADTMTVVDFSLERAGSLVGLVTDAASSRPLFGVAVEVFTSTGVRVGAVQTDSSGSYTWTGLSRGTYFVRTAGTAGYGDELYQGLPCAGGACTVTAGEAVTVLGGHTRSGVDFALAWTPMPVFDDDPLVVRTTPIRARHLSELRARVAALWMRHGLGAIQWTDPAIVPGVTAVKAVHLTELRRRIVTLYAALGLARPEWNAAVAANGRTVVSADAMAELRAAVAALWPVGPGGGAGAAGGR